MTTNLFPNFLEDADQYELSERYWRNLWDRIAPAHQEQLQWKTPWMGTGSPDIKDGNPIFSAYSPVLRRGIRVIQEESIDSKLDIRAWLDTFGGNLADPDRIQELVISCTLSDAAAIARRLMGTWVSERALSLESNQHWLSTSAG